MEADDLTFAIDDRAVFLPEPETLVIADTHLGLDATSSVDIPLGEDRSITDRVSRLVSRFAPSTVAVAGDVLHAFSHLPPGVPEALEGMVDRIEEAGASVTLIEGNHDPMLGSVVEPVGECRLDDGTVICHGHDRPEAEGDRYVIGHEHPAIRIEGTRRPCFLFGETAYAGADVLCLPAFNELTAGTLVNRLRGADMQSPLLADVGRFRPIVRDPDGRDPFVFPPLDTLRSFL